MDLAPTPLFFQNTSLVPPTRQVIGEQHQGTLEATRKATKATQKNTQQTQDGRFSESSVVATILLESLGFQMDRVKQMDHD